MSLISCLRTSSHTAAQGLNRVAPKKTLLVSSMPCEEKCAQIRNSTVDAWERNDNNTLAELAYRYLQNRQGQRNTTIEAVGWSFLPPAGIFHTIPNVGNRGRYKKTTKFTKKHLIDRLGRDAFKQIKALKFNHDGIRALIPILERLGLNTESIAPKANKEFYKSSFWGLGES